MRYPQECSPAFDRSARFELVDGFPESGHPPDQGPQRSQRRQRQAPEQRLGVGSQPFDIVGDHRSACRSDPHRDRQRDLTAHLTRCHLLEDMTDCQGPPRCGVGGDLGCLLGDSRVSEAGQREVTGELDELGDAEIRKFDLRHRGERTVIVDRPRRDDDVQSS